MTRKTRGAIAAGHPKTAEAGWEMFQLGGNAFDAVVAATLAACVAEPTLTSLAGGGFLLAHTQQQRSILFDFFTQTPGQQKDPGAIDFYPVQVNFGSATQEFHVGLGSMAVPGVCKGLFHVHQQLGRLPFEVVAQPAIHYAKTGVQVGDFQAYCFKILAPIWLAADENRLIAAPRGELLQPGDTLFMPEFADTLAYLVEAGPRAFYEGEIGQQLIASCQERGGYLTQADLHQYQVIERQPLKTTYRDDTFLTNPPPSSGGALIAFALMLLSHLDVCRLEFGSHLHLTQLAEVMRLTNQARQDGYDANLYNPDVARQFLAIEHLNRYKQQLCDGVNKKVNRSSVNKWGSTTHISVIDDEGNAASATTSNGEGSSYIIPGTGIMVNNMLGEADLHPHGFQCWQENVRISSMMAPTILLRQGEPAIVLGSGGSNRIRTAILQVISNLLDFKLPVEQAVNRPRVHWEDGVFNLEPGFTAVYDPAIFPFTQDVVLWDAQNMFFGGVHTVFKESDGTLSGAGDRRRNGAIAVS
jgi:gamma-glutamyltranspeptidase/glutathione hydrolase